MSFITVHSDYNYEEINIVASKVISWAPRDRGTEIVYGDKQRVHVRETSQQIGKMLDEALKG
jgi:hypothetical protein